MFRDKMGRLRLDAEVLAEKMENLSDEEVEMLAEKREILRESLNSFNAQLGNLTERKKRNALLVLLFSEITEIIFDHHLSLLASESRQKVACAETRQDKAEVLRDFHAAVEDLALLYRIT